MSRNQGWLCLICLGHWLWKFGCRSRLLLCGWVSCWGRGPCCPQTLSPISVDSLRGNKVGPTEIEETLAVESVAGITSIFHWLLLALHSGHISPRLRVGTIDSDICNWSISRLLTWPSLLLQPTPPAAAALFLSEEAMMARSESMECHQHKHPMISNHSCFFQSSPSPTSSLAISCLLPCPHLSRICPSILCLFTVIPRLCFCWARVYQCFPPNVLTPKSDQPSTTNLQNPIFFKRCFFFPSSLLSELLEAHLFSRFFQRRTSQKAITNLRFLGEGSHLAVAFTLSLSLSQALWANSRVPLPFLPGSTLFFPQSSLDNMHGLFQGYISAHLLSPSPTPLPDPQQPPPCP